MGNQEFKFRKKLGQLLLEKNLVSEDKLRWAMEEKAKSKKYLGEILIDAGLVKEEQILQILAEQADIPFHDLKMKRLKVNKELISIIPPEVIKNFKILPYAISNDSLKILIGSTSSLKYRSEISSIIGINVVMELTSKKHLDTIIANILENIPYKFDAGNPKCLLYRRLQLIGINISDEIINNKKKLGEFLVERDIIDEEKLMWALNEHHKTSKGIDEILLESDIISEEELLKVEALLFKTVFINLEGFTPKKEFLKYFTINEMSSLPFVPLTIDNGSLKIVVANMEKLNFFDKYRGIIPYKLEFYLGISGQIRNSVEKLKKFNEEIESDSKVFIASRIKEKRLGIMLVKMGYLSQEDFEQCWQKSLEEKKLLSEYLIDNNKVSQQIISRIKETQPDTKFVDLSSAVPDIELFKILPQDALVNNLAVPFKKTGDVLHIAIACDDPETVRNLEVLHLASNCTIEHYLAEEEHIIRILGEIYPDFRENIPEKTEIDNVKDEMTPEMNMHIKSLKVEEASFDNVKTNDINTMDELKNPERIIKGDELSYIDAIQAEFNKEKYVPLAQNEKDLLQNTANEKMVVNFLENIFSIAIRKKVSDIHFEPFENIFRIRFRMNGVLHLLLDTEPNIANPLIARLKVLSQLDLSEKRVAQDGSFILKMGDMNVEFRLLVCPCAYGETAVLRVLNIKNASYSLDKLGLSNSELYIIKKNLQRSYGLILVTGPTGSGKTTTLYSMLNYLNNTGSKIFTIEDPIEYHFPGIVQTDVKINKTEPEKSFDFADGLKASMRSDPDIIMLGEIRDENVAKVAVQASLTGHLVLATIHANNSIEVIGRLLNLGVERELLISSLKMVIAQRLVRKMCMDCKKKVENSWEFLKMLNFDKASYASYDFFQSPGCSKCGHTGYTGRIGIFEVLEITETLKSMIAAKKESVDIKKQALKEGLSTLKKSAFIKAVEGDIAIEEFVKIGLDAV